MRTDSSGADRVTEPAGHYGGSGDIRSRLGLQQHLGLLVTTSGTISNF